MLFRSPFSSSLLLLSPPPPLLCPPVLPVSLLSLLLTSSLFLSPPLSSSHHLSLPLSSPHLPPSLHTSIPCSARRPCYAALLASELYEGECHLPSSSPEDCEGCSQGSKQIDQAACTCNKGHRACVHRACVLPWWMRHGCLM